MHKLNIFYLLRVVHVYVNQNRSMMYQLSSFMTVLTANTINNVLSSSVIMRGFLHKLISLTGVGTSAFTNIVINASIDNK